jgi:hypothetical protein
MLRYAPFATLRVESGLPAVTLEERMRRGNLVAPAPANDNELVAYAWTTFTNGMDSGSSRRYRCAMIKSFDLTRS